MRKRLLWIVPLVVVLAVGAWFLFGRAGEGPPPIYTADVVATAPHDDQAFTEGLFYQNGAFYEGTGGDGTVSEGVSGIRKVNPDTGEVLASQDLPTPYFGEGVVAWKDRLLEVTWKDQKGFTYGLNDFAPRGGFDYKGEAGPDAGRQFDHHERRLGDAQIRRSGQLRTRSTLTVTANGCRSRISTSSNGSTGRSTPISGRPA